MKNAMFPAALAAAFLALPHPALAQYAANAIGTGSPMLRPAPEALPKAATAQSFGSRATVTSGATMYGAFEVPQPTVVYILVRGNSLQTLGVTNNYLDSPRLRLYSNGEDLIVDSSGRNGTNYCLASNTQLNAAVVAYYRDVRRQPVSERDACLAVQILQPGAFTFTVTPSISGVNAPTGVSSNPGSGEVLFEITLNP